MSISLTTKQIVQVGLPLLKTLTREQIISFKDVLGENLLMCFCYERNLEAIQFILGIGGYPIHAKDEKGSNAVHYFLYSKENGKSSKEKVLKTLSEAKISINTDEINGFAYAIQIGRWDTFELLCRFYDVNIQHKGFNHLHYACHQRKFEAVRCLLKHGAYEDQIPEMFGKDKQIMQLYDEHLMENGYNYVIYFLCFLKGSTVTTGDFIYDSFDFAQSLLKKIEKNPIDPEYKIFITAQRRGNLILASDDLETEYSEVKFFFKYKPPLLKKVKFE